MTSRVVGYVEVPFDRGFAWRKFIGCRLIVLGFTPFGSNCGSSGDEEGQLCFPQSTPLCLRLAWLRESNSAPASAQGGGSLWIHCADSPALIH
jgi:hypothetical protein